MRNLGKLTYSHTLTHACWQHSPGSHIHLARVFLCLPLGSREHSSCFHVPCTSPGQERTHLGHAAGMSATSLTLPASHTHFLWWTKLWCSLHNPCQGSWLSPKNGKQDRDEEKEEDLDRLPFSSTVHRGTDFLISAYFLPLVCASNWCLIFLCLRQEIFPVDLRISLILWFWMHPLL